MQIKSAQFIVSNTEVEKCPPEKRPEFAFIGRSNVGKSFLSTPYVIKKNLPKRLHVQVKHS